MTPARKSSSPTVLSDRDTCDGSAPGGGRGLRRQPAGRGCLRQEWHTWPPPSGARATTRTTLPATGALSPVGDPAPPTTCPRSRRRSLARGPTGPRSLAAPRHRNAVRRAVLLSFELGRAHQLDTLGGRDPCPLGASRAKSDQATATAWPTCRAPTATACAGLSPSARSLANSRHWSEAGTNRSRPRSPPSTSCPSFSTPPGGRRRRRRAP
jgi:hypothetical protein